MKGVVRELAILDSSNRRAPVKLRRVGSASSGEPPRGRPRGSALWPDALFEEAPLDHSTVSRTRRRIDFETYRAVFTWVLKRLADASLLKGQTASARTPPSVGSTATICSGSVILDQEVEAPFGVVKSVTVGTHCWLEPVSSEMGGGSKRCRTRRRAITWVGAARSRGVGRIAAARTPPRRTAISAASSRPRVHSGIRPNRP